MNYTQKEIEDKLTWLNSRTNLSISEAVEQKIAQDYLSLNAAREQDAKLIEQLKYLIEYYLGEWASVDGLYCPEEFTPLKQAQDAITAWRGEK